MNTTTCISTYTPSAMRCSKMQQMLPTDLVAYALSFLSGRDIATYSQTSKEAAKQIKEHHAWIERAISMFGALSRDFLEPPRKDLNTHSVFQNKKIVQLMIDYTRDEELSCYQMCQATVFKRVMDAFHPRIMSLFGGMNGYFQLPKVDPAKRILPPQLTLRSLLEKHSPELLAEQHSDFLRRDYSKMLDSLLLPSDLIDYSGRRFAIMRLDLVDGSKLIAFNTRNEIAAGRVSYRVHTIGFYRSRYALETFQKRMCDWDVTIADLVEEIQSSNGTEFLFQHSSFSGMLQYVFEEILSCLKNSAVYSANPSMHPVVDQKK